MPSSKRSSPNFTRDRWVRPLQSEKATHRHFDRHCPADTRSARRCSRRLSADQFGAGDVSAGRSDSASGWRQSSMPGRKALPPLLRKGQSQGSVRRDVESRRAASFLIAMVEGYGSLAKNAQDAKVMESGNQKYRGLAEVSSRAGQPQAGLIASMSQGMFDAVTYQPVRMLGQSASRSGEALQTTS